MKTRLTVRTFSFLAAAAVASICCTPLPAAGQTLFGTVTFNSFRTGAFQIFSMSATGTNLRRLSRAGYNDYFASTSADGTKVVFVSSDNAGNKSICMFDSSGGNRTTLVTQAGTLWYPALSPNGRYLAYGHTNGLYVLDLMSRFKTPVLLSSRIGVTIPCWSPNGQQIAFSHQPSNGTRGDLFKINIDGTGLVNITNTSQISETCPAWHGDSIAFLQSQSSPFVTGDLFVTDTAGFNRRALTSGGFVTGRPAWSPDGQWIAFSALTSTGKFALFATTLSNYFVQLTPDTGDDYDPSWNW